MRKLFLLILIVGLTTTVSLAVNAEPFGTNLGEYNGVISYSNGYAGYVSNQSNYYAGQYTGMRWQCVEYCRRYYLQHYDYYLDETVGYAQECFNTWGANAEIGQHTNGSSTTPPAVGDIICASGGGTGHVAVVRAVSGNSVTVIQQNFTNTYSDASYTLTLSQSGGQYTVGGFSGNYPVQGWLGLDELDDWINITSPSEAEVWVKGHNYAIEWDVVPGVSNVLIHLYKYIGGTWQMYIPVQNNTSNDGYYYPFNPGDDWEEGQIYQIRMANVDGTPSYGESGSFYVAGRLDLYDPNTTTFSVGDYVPINWYNSGGPNPITQVKLELHRTPNGGNNWQHWLTIHDSTPNDGSFGSCQVNADWNSSYDYKIVIRNVGTGWLPYNYVNSESDRFYVNNVPSPPTLVSPASGSLWEPTTVTFVWNPSDGATSYVLQVDTDMWFSNPDVNQTVYGTQWTVSGLENGTAYNWRVKAQNGDGESEFCDPWSFWTQLAIPTLISPPNGATGQSTSPTLSWNACTGATSYGLLVDDDQNFSSPIFEDNVSNVTSFQLTNLGYGTTYYWKVRAVSPAGTTEYCNPWSFTTIVPVPDQPTLSSPEDGATGVPTSPLLVWNAAAHASSYSLCLDNDPGFGNPIISENVGNVTSYQVNNLDLSTTHYWKVRAHNNTGDSPWSEVWSFTTVSPDPFVTVTYPNGGEIWNLGEEQTITWDDNFDENVMIELYLGQVVMWVEPDTPSDGEYLYTPTMLPESSDYWIKISKVDEPVVNDSSDGPFTIQPPGPDLTFIMTPYTTVLPPNGGWVYYSVSLTNGGGPLMGLTYWTDALLPDGTLYPNRPETYGPFNLPGGYDNPSIQRQVFVPAAAPAGEYVYYGRIGYDPNIEVQDSFTFTKMASGALGSGGDFDWPTQYSHSLVPDLAGEAGQNVSVEMPSEYAVSIYPNPFNPTLTASISMPESGDLSVRVFGIDGRLIAELAHGSFEQGRHQLVFDGTHLASGVYFIQATIPGKMNVVRKAILLR